MYLMYVDESGDPGLHPPSPSRYFVLSGLVIHELRWKDLLEDFVSLRRYFKAQYGLKLREEIHAGAFLQSPGDLARIHKFLRLEILRKVLDWVAARPEFSVTTIVVDKENKSQNVFHIAWQALIQRFENTIAFGNFPPPKWGDDKGLLLSDNTNGMELVKLMRQMRRFNPVPANPQLGNGGYRNLTLRYIVEDPFLKDSAQSYYHQIVDVIAYFARQMFETTSYLRKRGGANYYKRLEPVLNRRASSRHPLGIVCL